MKLGALTDSDDDSPVTGFAIDHRKVAPGTVFGAFKGQRFNGEDFIPAAVSAGAVAVVARPEAHVEGAVRIAADEPRREFARLAAKFFQPFPRDRGRGHRDQRQDLDRRAVPAALADDGASVGEHRDAWSHHLGRSGDDRADHARHRHLPFEHGRAAADGNRARRVRGIEPRPVAISGPRGCRCGPRPSPISAATISTITKRCTPISRPRCGCSRRWLRPTESG